VTIEFEISAGMTNPVTDETTEAFVISTADSSGNIIDSNNAVTMTATP